METKALKFDSFDLQDGTKSNKRTIRWYDHYFGVDIVWVITTS
ncbi:hypothetical protein OH492_15410 [Vibrio chagasii]|nr:hypothetical protein [Vibrio chagasii]